MPLPPLLGNVFCVAMQKGRERTRSTPEPGPTLQCGSVFRERRRETEAGYEAGKDRAAYWISQWSHEEMCAVLYHLVCRCRKPQLNTLHTSLECIPHRDLQMSAVGVSSGLELCPVSTPLSRQVRVRLRKSRRPQNRRLYRAQSVVIHEEPPIRPSPSPSPSSHFTLTPFFCTGHPTQTPSLTVLSHHHLSLHTHTHTPLAHISSFPHIPTSLSPFPHVITPTVRCSTAPARPLSSPDSRTLTTPRRHMLTTPITHHFHCRLSSRGKVPPDLHSLPSDATQFLVWFSDLRADWQQQEVLHLIVLNLDSCELYYLSTLLISRQFRDFISCLSEPLALHLLSYVPAKDLLRNCAIVSRVWHNRCTSEGLWKRLCLKTSLGVPVARGLSWRRLFMDSLRLKHNWWRGHCAVRTLGGHTGRVLCVKIRDSIVATGSSDHTIRIWSLESCQCLQVLNGHTKGVWCLCFYGKRLLISGSSDHCIKVWNIETGICERTVEAHGGIVWCVQQKQEVLLTGSHDKTVSTRAWKPAS